VRGREERVAEAQVAVCATSLVVGDLRDTANGLAVPLLPPFMNIGTYWPFGWRAWRS